MFAYILEIHFPLPVATYFIQLYTCCWNVFNSLFINKINWVSYWFVPHSLLSNELRTWDTVAVDIVWTYLFNSFDVGYICIELSHCFSIEILIFIFLWYDTFTSIWKLSIECLACHESFKFKSVIVWSDHLSFEWWLLYLSSALWYVTTITKAVRKQCLCYF